MEFGQNKYQVMFIGGRSFKSKAGKQCNVVSFAAIDKKTMQGQSSDMFIDNMPALVASLKFGDMIEIVTEALTPSSKPRLVSVERKVADTPFKFA